MVDMTVIGMLIIPLHLAIELSKPFQGYLTVTPQAFEFIWARMAGVTSILIEDSPKDGSITVNFSSETPHGFSLRNSFMLPFLEKDL